VLVLDRNVVTEKKHVETLLQGLKGLSGGIRSRAGDQSEISARKGLDTLFQSLGLLRCD
jgi:hypothetical protein